MTVGVGGGAAADMTAANASGGGSDGLVNPATRSQDGVSTQVEVTWNATPIVPRPPWVPMTGPISPTTMSPE